MVHEKPYSLSAAEASGTTGRSVSGSHWSLSPVLDSLRRWQMGRRPPDTCAQGRDPGHRQHVESGTEAELEHPSPHTPALRVMGTNGPSPPFWASLGSEGPLLLWPPPHRGTPGGLKLFSEDSTQ